MKKSLSHLIGHLSSEAIRGEDAVFAFRTGRLQWMFDTLTQELEKEVAAVEVYCESANTTAYRVKRTLSLYGHRGESGMVSNVGGLSLSVRAPALLRVSSHLKIKNKPFVFCEVVDSNRDKSRLPSTKLFVKVANKRVKMTTLTVIFTNHFDTLGVTHNVNDAPP